MFIIFIFLWLFLLENFFINLFYIDICFKYFKIIKEYFECVFYVKCIIRIKFYMRREKGENN